MDFKEFLKVDNTPLNSRELKALFEKLVENLHIGYAPSEIRRHLINVETIQEMLRYFWINNRKDINDKHFIQLHSNYIKALLQKRVTVIIDFVFWAAWGIILILQ